MPARHVSEAVSKAVRASIPHYRQRSLKHVFVRFDRDTVHHHPSFAYDTVINAFKERNLLHRPGGRCRWYFHGLGGANHNANIF